VGRHSEWGLAIQEILSDGEWHEREVLYRAGMKQVPPGRAFRQAEKNRDRFFQERHGTNAPARKRGNDETAIAAGQRMLVTGVLTSQVRTGRYEKKEVDGKVYVRDKKIHDKFVEEQGGMVVDLLDHLERQLRYWNNALGLIGGDRAVRAALIGGDPVAELKQVLEKYGRNVGEESG